MKIAKYLFVLLCVWQSKAQESTVISTPLSTQASADELFYGRDAYGAIYSGTKQLLNKTADKQLWQYKNPSLGSISQVILTNPLKIVLYYESFNTVVLLDNQLNEIEKVVLSSLATPLVASAVGLAEGNKLWIYNSLTNQLGLLNLKNKDYQVISTPFTESMAYYQTDFNKFQWIDQAHNWYECSIYGKINLLGTAPEYDSIQLDRNHGLVYCINQELYYYSRIEESKTLLNVNKKSCTNFRFKDQILTIFTTPEISNYKILAP